MDADRDALEAKWRANELEQQRSRWQAIETRLNQTVNSGGRRSSGSCRSKTQSSTCSASTARQCRVAVMVWNRVIGR